MKDDYPRKPKMLRLHPTFGQNQTGTGRSYNRPLAAANEAYRRGELAYRSGDNDEAISWFQEATSCFDEHVASWYMLGVCLSETGDLKAAEDALNKALALNPKYKPALEAVSVLRAGAPLSTLEKRQEKGARYFRTTLWRLYATTAAYVVLAPIFLWYFIVPWRTRSSPTWTFLVVAGLVALVSSIVETRKRLAAVDDTWKAGQ